MEEEEKKLVKFHWQSKYSNVQASNLPLSGPDSNEPELHDWFLCPSAMTVSLETLGAFAATRPHSYHADLDIGVQRMND